MSYSLKKRKVKRQILLHVKICFQALDIRMLWKKIVTEKIFVEFFSTAKYTVWINSQNIIYFFFTVLSKGMKWSIILDTSYSHKAQIAQGDIIVRYCILLKCSQIQFQVINMFIHCTYINFLQKFRWVESAD